MPQIGDIKYINGKPHVYAFGANMMAPFIPDWVPADFLPGQAKEDLLRFASSGATNAVTAAFGGGNVSGGGAYNRGAGGGGGAPSAPRGGAPGLNRFSGAKPPIGGKLPPSKPGIPVNGAGAVDLLGGNHSMGGPLNWGSRFGIAEGGQVTNTTGDSIVDWLKYPFVLGDTRVYSSEDLLDHVYAIKRKGIYRRAELDLYDGTQTSGALDQFRRLGACQDVDGVNGPYGLLVSELEVTLASGTSSGELFVFRGGVVDGAGNVVLDWDQNDAVGTGSVDRTTVEQVAHVVLGEGETQKQEATLPLSIITMPKEMVRGAVYFAKASPGIVVRESVRVPEHVNELLSFLDNRSI